MADNASALELLATLMSDRDRWRSLWHDGQQWEEATKR